MAQTTRNLRYAQTKKGKQARQRAQATRAAKRKADRKRTLLLLLGDEPPKSAESRNENRRAPNPYDQSVAKEWVKQRIKAKQRKPSAPRPPRPPEHDENYNLAFLEANKEKRARHRRAEGIEGDEFELPSPPRRAYDDSDPRGKEGKTRADMKDAARELIASMRQEKPRRGKPVQPGHPPCELVLSPRSRQMIGLIKQKKDEQQPLPEPTNARIRPIREKLAGRPRPQFKFSLPGLRERGN